MVQAMIDIPKQANQVLNIVKARYNLKTKSEAIATVVLAYGNELLEPNIRPAYLSKLQKIRKGKYTKYHSLDALRKATS